MDPAVSLILLRQGNRAIVDYVADFCELCDQVGFNDIALKDIFCFGLTKELSCLMPPHTPHWSLQQYIDFCRVCSRHACQARVCSRHACQARVCSRHASQARAYTQDGRQSRVSPQDGRHA